VGWFPSNYTQEEIDDPHTYCMAENVMDVMVALYPFKAQNDTELSFAKGDRLEVLDRPASDPEWFKVSLLCGSGSSRIRDSGMLVSVSSRVVDPYSFFTDPDPDPEFDVGEQYGYGSGSGSNPIRIQGFNDQKFKKNYS
jgi:hypothetical protein